MKATRDEVISTYGQEDADIRYSRKLESVEEKFERKVAENETLKKQLDETKKLLKDAQKELGSAAFDAWIADRETGGRVPLYEDALKVVAKYNDETLTGVTNEELTERIVRALVAMGDKAYAPDVLTGAWAEEHWISSFIWKNPFFLSEMCVTIEYTIRLIKKCHRSFVFLFVV